MPAESDQHRFEQLLRARHPCIAVTTFEEAYALEAVRHAALNQGRTLWIWSIIGGVRNGLLADMPPIPETEHPAAGLFHLLQQATPQTVYIVLDLVGHLRDERTLRVLRDLIAKLERNGNTLVMIDPSDAIPAVVQSVVTRFEISLPDEKELDGLVRETLREINAEKPLNISIARSTFKTIVKNLLGLTRRQARRVIADCIGDDAQFNETDLNTVLARKRQMLCGGGLLEFIETPTDLADVGGLERLKQWLARREGVFTQEAKSFGLQEPRGILLLGVQGAGKSLCAKAIATGWHKPLLRMDVGALYDRYIGESEKRLRDTLRQAEAMAPIVLWIDEIEKAFASAASRSTDGGLSQRMFATLLTWMQEHRAAVFLVATANDIEALPPELLRKGRFDEIFFVDLPADAARRQIFSIHLRKRGRKPEAFDMDALTAASAGFSGAEIEQAIVSALHDSYAEKADLNTLRLVESLQASPPLSITMAERVQSLRAWAQGRCVPAD